jgi:hypothetical protein
MSVALLGPSDWQMSVSKPRQALHFEVRPVDTAELTNSREALSASAGRLSRIRRGIPFRFCKKISE